MKKKLTETQKHTLRLFEILSRKNISTAKLTVIVVAALAIFGLGLYDLKAPVKKKPNTKLISDSDKLGFDMSKELIAFRKRNHKVLNSLPPLDLKCRKVLNWRRFSKKEGEFTRKSFEKCLVDSITLVENEFYALRDELTGVGHNFSPETMKFLSYRMEVLENKVVRYYELRNNKL